MVMDRLGPFTGIIRSLWRARAEGATTTRAEESPRIDAAAPEGPAPVERDSPDLREHLRKRLASLTKTTREGRRAAFVETVLLWELSDSASTDPHFVEVINRVTRELNSDPRVSARLDDLLTELSGTSPP